MYNSEECFMRSGGDGLLSGRLGTSIGFMIGM